MQRAQEKQHVLSFLRLPAELRNQIYERVFQGWIIAIRPSSRHLGSLEADIWPDNTSPYRIVGGRSSRLNNRSTNVFSLLYTCRQIYAETRLLPYGLSTVLCGEAPFPPAWLAGLNVQLTQVSSLQLCSYMPANIALSRTWLEILPRFSDLKKVEIHWQLQVPQWGAEEDHLSTATADEIEMTKKIIKATSAVCEVSFHRTVVWE